MKQAVLITAYKDFNYLIDFAKYLSKHELLVFIHVDKKSVNSSVLQQLNAIPNVVAISEYKVPWGGYQHVQAFLALIRLALQCDQRMYLHLVTGQDCLCRPIQELDDFFCEDNDNNYMSCSEQSDSFRCRTYYRNDWFNYKSTCGNFITKASHIIQKVVGVKRHCPNHYNVYKGMVYVSITSDFASYILSFLNTREGKQYFNWLKWCFIPEEFFFQTILMNSPFSETLVKNNYRYALWAEKHGAQPGILDEIDIEQIKKSNAFFARKISYKYSEKLLNNLGII